MLANFADRVEISKMSTNEIIAILEQLGKAKRGFAVDWNVVMPAISMIVVTLVGLWLKRDIKEVKETTSKTAETVKEVKLDVNSGRTKLEDKLTKVEEKLLVVTGERAASDEKVRSEQDKAVALAAVRAAAPSPAAAPDTGKASSGKRMGAAITELAEAAEETKESSEETTESAERTEELARKHKTS